MFRLLVLAVPVAALALTAPAAVQTSRGDHGEHYMSCAKACDDCGRICDACAAHCVKMVADGKRDHLNTVATCADCAAACKAASCVVARMGPFSDLMCTACADACKRCGDACAQFTGDAMMKRCADECRKCEAACRDMLKHVVRK